MNINKPWTYKNKMKKKAWQCARCGKCCKFIVIPVEHVSMETQGYLDAHGIACDGKKLIIPAICQYLKKGDLREEKGEYYCSIHNNKFVNCRLGGEKECKEAQKAWSLLNPK
jgi:Fe-S-cluster containining protein